MAVEVFEQELELAGEQHTVDLDAGAGRDVGAPVVFLVLRDVDSRDRPPARWAGRPGARELRAVLDRQGLEARRILAEEIAAAGVQAEQVAELVGELEVDALIAQVDPLGAGPEQELVPQVATFDGRRGASSRSPRSGSSTGSRPCSR